MKTCTKCKIEKDETEFSKAKREKDGLQSKCKACEREYRQANAERIAEYQGEYRQENAEQICEKRREYYQANAEQYREYYQTNAERICERTRKYKQENAEKIAEQKREYQQENAEKIAEYQRGYYQANAEHLCEKQREYYQTNAEQICEKQREYHQTEEAKAKRSKRRNDRYQIDPSIRIANCMSSAISLALKGKKAGRHWEKLVGYTVNDLMQHLETKFTPEMSWENYGSYWHDDHIVPKSWFAQTDPAEFKACWALSNLQPLEATENIKKGNRYAG